MLRPHNKMTACSLLAAILLQGCAAGPFRLQYLWDKDPQLSYYVDKASAVEFPVESEPHETDPELFNRPRGIRSLEEVESREISLNECVRLALSQAAVIRDDGSFGSPSNGILNRPAQVSSVYDPAIQGSGFLFGNRGTEAALADFDALATTSLTWGRDETPQNSGTLGLSNGATQTLETFAWQSSLEKPLAHGGTVTLSSNTSYEGNNRPLTAQFEPSTFTGRVQAEYRQPLWAGAGTEFTRIAGPANQSLRGVSGVSQGVLISRINGDISLTQFEQSVQTLVHDVEQRYWDLNLALRLYESERDAFIQLQTYYQKLRARADSSVPVLSAEARIYEADARIRGSLADVLDAEARLRRLCNLPISDEHFLYPTDTPSEAMLEPLWDATLQEAFAHRIELRRQKWEIKSLELQLKAAKSLTRPRLDAVTQYRVNALGDVLAGDHDQPLDTMLGNLAGGQNTGWSFGVQGTLPIGLRLSRIQVRNYELRLAKARAVLGEQEREIGYEISAAMLNMERWYELADSTTRRIETSRKHVDAVEGFILGTRDVTPGSFETLLNAKIQSRDAEQAYMRSVIEYNKAITDFKFRKGTMLIDHEVYLAEGNWHPAAAPFAMQRAVSRTYAKDQHKLRSTPMEFVGGAALGSWESLGTDTRPSTPGALGENPQPGTIPSQSVPGIPELMQPTEPVPPPGFNGEPLPVPPPINDVPEVKDVITQKDASGSGIVRIPAATTAYSTGRVKL